MAESRTPDVHVEFGEAPWRDEVADVLRAVSYGGGDGTWRRRPDRIVVKSLLDGGRSGRDVLEIVVEWGNARGLRVAKLDRAAEIADEWRGYQLIGGQVDGCAPIEATTPGVRDASQAAHTRREAVVYHHVSDYAGALDQQTVTLERLARQGCDDGPDAEARAVEAIGVLGEKARAAFYRHYERAGTATTLRYLNPTLGPDLVLRVEGIGIDGGAAGSPLRQDAAMRDGSRLDGDLTPGQSVLLEDVTLSPRGDGVRGAFSSDVTVDLQMPDALAGARGTVSLRGRVVATRAQRAWQLITECVPDLVHEDGEVRQGGARTPVPFARLHELLNEPATGRVTSWVHGDLNPRNATVVRGQPYLYDYAMTRADRPLLADFGWLELGLLRDAVATGLTFADVLRLQRLLNAASVLTDVTGAQSAATAVGDIARGLDRRLGAPFRILWAVRAAARRSYPHDAGPAWWRDYLSHLIISANRTFKWPAAEHGPGAVAATVAAAGAATEAIGPAPYAHWPTPDLAALAPPAFEILSAGRLDAFAPMAGLVSELDRRGVRRDDVDAALARARAAILHRALGAEAALLADRWRDGDEPSLTLHATDGGESALRGRREDRLAGRDVREAIVAARHVALLGGAGSGKSTVLRQVGGRLAAAVSAGGPASAESRFPVMCDARDLAQAVGAADPATFGAESLAALPARATGAWPADAAALLRTGAVALLVDGLDHLAAVEGRRVAALLRAVRAAFPRAMIVVCRRRAGYRHTLLGGFEHLALRDPSPEAIERYLAEVFLHRRVERAWPRAASLTRVLTDESSPRRLADFRSPALLSLVASLAAVAEPSALPWSGVGELVGLYVRQRLGGTVDPDGERALARLAAELMDRHIDRLQEADVPDDLDPMVTAGILSRDDTAIGFEHPTLREYFAARWLQRERDGRVAERAADPRWHEACRMLLTLPGTDPRLSTAVVTAVLDDDPIRAARLLRSMRTPPARLLDAFLERQQTTLRDVEAAMGARLVAAAAITEYGRPRAYQLLAALAGERSTPESRIATLEALEQTVTAARSTRARERAEDALAGAISTALTAPAPQELRVRALQTAERIGLPRLHLCVGELIDASQPWPVVSAAAAALRSAGVVWPRRLADGWADACERRLADVETELPETTSHAECDTLQDERRLLLAELWHAGRGEAVRTRRFRFDIAHDVRRLIAGSDDASDLVRPLDLTRLTATSPPEDLLQAAVQVERAPAGDRDAVAAVVRDLIERARVEGADAGLMEAIAALTSGVFAVDRPLGTRLALHGARVWEQTGLTARWRWPWLVAFVRARGLPEDLERLLLADEEGRRLAVIGLSSYRFFAEAGADPGYRLGERGRAALLAGSDTESDGEKWRRVMAAATVGAVEALPLACDLAAKHGFGETRRTVATAADGLTERDDLTGLLAAIGYLARLTAPHTPTDAVREAHRLVRDADLTGRGPDAANGRLAALAYLGDWQTVLADLDPGDPRSRRIAERAITTWLPGPLTPPAAATPDAVTDWITARLTVPGLPPDAASALARLREHRHGSAGPPGT